LSGGLSFAEQLVQMIGGLVELRHDLRQARGDTGETRAPRADHAIPVPASAVRTGASWVPPAIWT